MVGLGVRVRVRGRGRGRGRLRVRAVPAIPRDEAEVGVAHRIAHVGDALVGQLLAGTALAVGVEAPPTAAVRELRL